ncbi:MAG: hypothetical protein NTY37_13100 [Methanothrix sp.]|nr:hypothetical protein [Methanothrix sp.]
MSSEILMQEILVRQAQDGWGAKVIERLADDLRHEFSDMISKSIDR